MERKIETFEQMAQAAYEMYKAGLVERYGRIQVSFFQDGSAVLFIPDQTSVSFGAGVTPLTEMRVLQTALIFEDGIPEPRNPEKPFFFTARRRRLTT